MPLHRRVYDVHLNPAGYDPTTADPFDVAGVTTRRVVVTHADQMRGELEAGKRGLSADQPQNLTSVIVWCALVRTGAYTGKYDQFRNLDCAGMESPDPETEAANVVPPTTEPSSYGSDSPITSPATPTGQTPTSTSD